MSTKKRELSSQDKINQWQTLKNWLQDSLSPALKNQAKLKNQLTDILKSNDQPEVVALKIKNLLEASKTPLTNSSLVKAINKWSQELLPGTEKKRHIEEGLAAARMQEARVAIGEKLASPPRGRGDLNPKIEC